MEKADIKNNKLEVPLQHYIDLFRELDPEDAVKRTHVEFDAQKGEFHIRVMGVDKYVSWPEFSLKTADGTVVGGDEQILVIRFLMNAVVTPANGKFITYRELPWGEVYFRQFTNRCINRLAFSYATKLDKFDQIMETIGAERIDAGDSGWKFEFMDGFFVEFILWAPDDEFPPSAQILFSDNFPLAFGGEDGAYIGDISQNFLKKFK